MEHALPENATTPQELLLALGIADDATDETPPAWVTAELTDAQRAVLARLATAVAGNEAMMHTRVLALLLFKLALQPGLPHQAGGFLALAAADLLGAELLHRRDNGRGSVDMFSAVGLVRESETELAGPGVAEEDVDQDAGVPAGVGA